MVSIRREADQADISQADKRVEEQERSIAASEKWLVGRRSFLMAGCIALGSGCNRLVTRGQDSRLDPKELIENPSTPYVSNLTSVWGGEPAKIEGVGLVTDLNGTGSAPGPSRFRDELEADLKARDVDKVSDLLGEKWTSLVVLAGIVPAGAYKGAKFDVFVSLPPRSETSSLESGFLMPANLVSKRILAGRARTGRNAGSCKGQILTDSVFQTKVTDNSRKKGVVPGGGRLVRGRLYGLKLKSNARSMKEAVRITDAINRRFTYFENSRKSHVAKAKNDREIQLHTPEVYRENIYRYLHVIRAIAVGESARNRAGRMQALEAELMNPATAEIAALRLEAIGPESLGILSRGLTSRSPVVQFASAMAITYLGDDSACASLARLSEQNAAYRWHTLTALNSVGGTVAANQLKELLHSSEIETRYAATRSLVGTGQGGDSISSQQYVVKGRPFTVRTVYSTSAPAVHIARYKEPEIVIYNPDIQFQQNVNLVCSGWTVRGAGEGMVEIINYRSSGGDIRVTCPSYVEAVVGALASKGADYPKIAKLLHQAGDGGINGKVVVSALASPNRLKNPEAVSGMFNNEREALSNLESRAVSRRSAEDAALKNASKELTFAERIRGVRR